MNLGQVRQQLREWQRSSSYCPVTPAAKPLPSAANHQQVLLELAGMENAPSDTGYLVNQRKISPVIMADARFYGVIKIDQKCNAIFPHRDRAGICGYEIKGANFTGFSNGGSKGLWLSNQITQSNVIVLVESVIDALSHAQLRSGNAGYASFSGSLSNVQRELICGLVVKAAARAVSIIVATDNDAAGEQYFATITELANPVIVKRERPSAKDWNDELRGIA